MPAPDSSPTARWISVAHLLRSQGRRGEILADPQTDLPGIFVKGRELRLAASDPSAETARIITLEDCWQPQGRNAGRFVLKLSGIDSISEAEALEGKELFLQESALPDLEPDTFLVRDLVGCALFDGDRPLGSVIGLEFPMAPDGHTRVPDAADLLVVVPQDAEPEAEPVLVPFVKAWLQAVDLGAKRITMHLPPGLFD